MQIQKSLLKWVAALVTAIVVTATLFHFPITIVNAVTGAQVPEFGIHVSGWRILFEPFLGILLFFNQSFYAIKDTIGAKNLAPASQATWNPRTDKATIGGAANTAMFLPRNLISKMDDGTALTKVVSGVTSQYRLICSGATSQVSHVGVTTNGITTYPCINESGATMDWSAYAGWYVDLPDSGERVNVDMNLSLGTLTFASNVPASNACTSGGYGWLNYLDYRTGLAVRNTPPAVSTKVGNSLIVGINVVKLPSGSLTAIVTTSDNQQLSISPSFQAASFTGKRNLWREFEVY